MKLLGDGPAMETTELRQLAADEMLANPDEYAPFLDSELVQYWLVPCNS